MASRNREYAEGFFPADDKILANRSVWTEWFHVKKTLTDSKWTSIDEWIGNGTEVEELSSDAEFVVIEDYGSSVDSPKNPEVQGNNLQLCKNQMHKNELTKTLNLIENYYADIVNERLVKWQKNGLDGLLPPASKKMITIPEKVNDCFDNFNSFKGKVRIKETRTISITHDSDSVDTADYIRGARGKGNKSVPAKNKNRLIKKYYYKTEIKSNQPYGLKRNKKIVQRFPLDSNSGSPSKTSGNKKSKKKSNESHYPLNDSESSSRYSSIKMKRKRLQRQSKVGESRSHSSSSTDTICFRGRNANFNSRSVRQLNRKHISSDITSDDSDPDDKILDKVRKTYKEIEKPLQILDSQNTLNETAQPIIEFPAEPEFKLVLYDRKKNLSDNQIVIISDCSEEDSEDDFIFMTNKKRLDMYGVTFEEQPNNCQSLLKYNRGSNIQNNSSDGSSTDDFLFKIKSYET